MSDEQHDNQEDYTEEQVDEQTDKNIIGDRSVFHPNIWADEFDKFGITPDMPTSEAKTIARKAMGLPERHTEGGLKSAVRKATKDASPEQVREALAVLSGGKSAEADADEAQE